MIKNMPKVEWAPINVPMHRRMETLSAGIWMFTLVFGEFIMLFSYIALLFFGNIYIKTLCLLYLAHIYRGREIGDRGGKPMGYNWMRNSFIWKWFKNYFPVDLVKTTELPPDQNYLFAVFPHGILSTGAFCNFATNASNFKKLFPGIRPRLITLNFHFQIPFFRELIFAWGLASASANSLRSILFSSNDPNAAENTDGYTSNAAILVVGGAQEALNCRPKNYQLVVKKRKGFIKIAIATGVSIVPVFSFGEVDVFDQPANPPGSSLRKFQDWVKSVTGMAPAIFIGRGFFQYSFGIIPKRRPITTVVGSPIHVTKNDNPTWDEVNRLHAQFVKSLTELFEENKAKYISDAENVKLIIE